MTNQDGGIMEHGLNQPNRYTLILDTETINSVIEHAANLKLARRECHPLDRYRGQRVNNALAKYDAEMDTAPVTKAELAIVDTIVETKGVSEPVDHDFDDEEF